jgi:quinol monooxygenase YgiN
MAAVRIVVIIKAKPGSEAIVAKIIAALGATSPSDPGCTSYESFASVARPGEFVTIEAWESQADLDAHMQTPAVQAALGAVGDHLDGEPITHVLGPVEG